MNRLILSLSTALLVLVGCGTPAAYKDPNGRDLVVSLDQVNIQDFASAGAAMLQSMSNAPALNQQPPAVLKLGTVTNDTTVNFDTSLLLSKLTVPLVNSGRIVLLESDVAADAARQAQGAEGQVPQAQLVLKGKILEDRANAGSTRQASYVFQLTLVDVKRGVALWTEEKIVTKQGTKNTVGF